MRRMAFAVLTVATALFTGLFTASVAGAQTPAATIDAVDFPGPSFQPPNVTITTGETVRWEFDQALSTHTLTSSSANWTIDETRAPGGASIDRTFGEAGLYNFLCRIHGAMNGSVTVEDEPPADPLENVLVFSETAGFRHDSIPQGIAAIQQLGQQNDFAVTATEDSAQFNDANLAQYDAVVFLSTTGDVLDDAAAGRVRALHPGRRRLRRHPRGGRHRVHVGLVRPDAGRLLQEPPARDTAGVGRHRGHRRTLHGDGPGPLAADRRVVQLPIALQPVRGRRRRRLQPARQRREGPRDGRRDDLRRAGRQRGRRRSPDRVVQRVRRRQDVVHGHGPHPGLVQRARLPRAHPRRPPDRDRRRGVRLRRAAPGGAGGRGLREGHARRRHAEPVRARRRRRTGASSTSSATAACSS